MALLSIMTLSSPVMICIQSIVSSGRSKTVNGSTQYSDCMLHDSLLRIYMTSSSWVCEFTELDHRLHSWCNASWPCDGCHSAGPYQLYFIGSTVFHGISDSSLSINDAGTRLFFILGSTTIATSSWLRSIFTSISSSLMSDVSNKCCLTCSDQCFWSC